MFEFIATIILKFSFYKVSEDQIDFMKVFNKLNDYEKSKLLDSLTEEERQNLILLRDEYEK